MSTENNLKMGLFENDDINSLSKFSSKLIQIPNDPCSGPSYLHVSNLQKDTYNVHDFQMHPLGHKQFCSMPRAMMLKTTLNKCKVNTREPVFLNTDFTSLQGSVERA